MVPSSLLRHTSAKTLSPITAISSASVPSNLLMTIVGDQHLPLPSSPSKAAGSILLNAPKDCHADSQRPLFALPSYPQPEPAAIESFARERRLQIRGLYGPAWTISLDDYGLESTNGSKRIFLQERSHAA